MTSSLLLLLLAGAGASAAGAMDFKPSPDEARAARSVTRAALASPIRYLASDKLEGRAPGSAGDLLAQQYIEQRFRQMGLEPGAPGGGYRQPLDLVGVTGAPEVMSLRGKDGAEQRLRTMQDFVVVPGRPVPESRVDGAELVFVGYGIVAPEFQWDDYKGADLKGKVLVMMNSDPEDDPNLFAGKVRLWYGRWDYKYEQAARTGAAGALIIHTTPSAGYPWQVVQTSWSGEQFDLPDAPPPRLEMEGWLSEDATKRIAALAGRDLEVLRASAQHRDFKPIPLGVRISAQFKSQVHRITTANVIGKISGRDPALREQVVLYTAHHDHLGKVIDARPGQDGVYNGAVDNASGVAEMLVVARAFQSLRAPPRRTVYFAAVAAEEAGLLGSTYLSQHLPVPAGDVACDINIDGANIWGRARDLMMIGYGKSDLDAAVEAIARWQHRVVTPDQLPDRGFFYRSDQFSFAKLGIPAAYAESGTDFVGRPPGWGKLQKEKWEEAHYHQPSDEFDPRWDLSGAVDDTQLYFYLGNLVGNRDALPVWSSGDEFELARRAALRAVETSTSHPKASDR
ncbi:MAG TPA: M28 family peptidase [Myxococcales bacterium]|nr:M28 family peptidase [Myxococcales bacterium]